MMAIEVEALDSAARLTPQQGGKVSRSEIVFWLNLMLALGSLSLLVGAQSRPNYVSQAQNTSILVLAWLSVFWSTRDLGRQLQADWVDIAFAIAVGVTSLLPDNLMYVSVIAYAVYLIHRYKADAAARNAAMLLLALAANRWLAELVFLAIGSELNSLDAYLVSLTYDSTLYREGPVLVQNSLHGIEIAAECSSFHNISLGILFWAVLVNLGQQSLKRADLLVLMSVVAGLLIVNVLRLHLMTRDFPSYIYWHNDHGKEIYSYIFGAAMIVPPLSRLWFTRDR